MSLLILRPLRAGSLFLAALLVSVATLAAGALASPASPGTLSVPPGWEITGRFSPGKGVEHFQLHHDAGPFDAQVVRVTPGQGARLRAVVSEDRIAGPTNGGERTSAICARARCLAAVNADFAKLPTDQPVGALVTGGRWLRTPVATHHQFSVGWGAALATGLAETRLRLVTTDLVALDIDGVNVGTADGLVLHTPAWGPRLEAGPGEELMAVHFGEGPAELAAGETRVVHLDPATPAVVELSGQAAVLRAVGSGVARLAELRQRVASGAATADALLRLESSIAVRESVGGTPVVVREGRRWVQPDGTDFNDSRHPRTAAAWDASGRVLLVTVDGRQPGFSVGMSLPELADFLVGVGAVEALNLDGGGSTTMVVAGQVANRPSDRFVRRAGRQLLARTTLAGDIVLGPVERPVTTALVVVPDETAASPMPVPVDPGQILRSAPPRPLPSELALPAGDPASQPDGSAPVVLALAAGEQADPSVGLNGAVAILAVALQLVLVTAVIRGRRPASL